MSNAITHSGFGLVLVVLLIACILFGTVLTQSYIYYTKYPRDPLKMKLYVASILVLDVLSTFFACLWQYDLLIVHWGEDSEVGLAQDSPYFAMNPLFCGIMGFLVHSFFAWRIFMITRSKWLTGLTVLFALCAATGAIATCIAALMQIGFAKFGRLPFGQMWLIGSALTDLIITGALTHHLRKRRGDFENTNHILDRVVRLTVQNGLLTSAVALSDLILFVIFHSPTHTVSFLIPKLYSNTVLSSLNSRRAESNSDSWAMSATGAETNVNLPVNRHQSIQYKPGQSSRYSAATTAPSKFTSMPPAGHVAIHIDTERMEAIHEDGDLGVRPLSTDTGVMKSTWRKDVKSRAQAL